MRTPIEHYECSVLWVNRFQTMPTLTDTIFSALPLCRHHDYTVRGNTRLLIWYPHLFSLKIIFQGRENVWSCTKFSCDQADPGHDMKINFNDIHFEGRIKFKGRLPWMLASIRVIMWSRHCSSLSSFNTVLLQNKWRIFRLMCRH